MKRSKISFESGTNAAAVMFGRSGRVARLAATVGLLTSLAAFAALMIQIENNAAAIGSAQLELSQLRSGVHANVVAPKAEFRPQQGRALIQITQQLNTPWSQLLDVLEASLPPDVALVSIEPDGASGKVRIQAEAKALETLIAYAGTLRHQPTFTAVELVKHETNEQDANRPVRLILNVSLSALQTDEQAAVHAEGNVK